MTKSELKVDQKEVALGCAVIIGCALVCLIVGGFVGVGIYKHWIL